MSNNKNGEILSRETTSCSSIAAWAVVLGSLDTARQLVGYQVTVDGGARSSLIVLCSECLKLIILFLVLLSTGNELTKVHKFSLWLLFPASIYALTNNLFYYGISLVPPPIWAILNQTKVIFLGIVYRFIFKRQFTPYQWVGLFFLLVAVTLTAATGDDSKHKTYTSSDLLFAGVLALGASFLSAIGPIVVEWRLKNDESRSFAVQQFQLYALGLLSCLVVVTIDIIRKPMIEEDFQLPQLSVVFAVILTAACGLTVAAVVKKTDNVVKVYTQSIATVSTALLCAVIFPYKCHIHLPIFLSLLLTLVGISFYEHQALSNVPKPVIATSVIIAILTVVLYILYEGNNLNLIKASQRSIFNIERH